MDAPNAISSLKSKINSRENGYNNYVKFLLEAANSGYDSVLSKYKSSEQGISDEEAQLRLKEHGKNDVAEGKRPTFLTFLVRSVRNPLIILLILIATISYLTKNLSSVYVISVMLIISIALRIVQEMRASISAEKLKSMVKTTATVMREGKKKEIPLSSIVPGDIIHLSAGDMVPADLRVISSKDLFVNQSVLTGEVMPVEKYSRKAENEFKSPLDISNLCFMGTNIESGIATAVVILTGKNTCLGSLAKGLHKEVVTVFDTGIKDFTWLMIKFIIAMVLSIFLINGALKGNWVESFLFALAIAIGLTPEMLPMIVTVNLSKGAIAMTKKKVVVKRLNSIQNFGAMDILCTDKTGTITQGKVIIVKHIDPLGNEESEQVLNYAFLNSYFQTGLKSIIDTAVLEYSHEYVKFKADSDYKKIDEVAFDFFRKRMSVIVEDKAGNHILVSKGAVDELLGVCNNAEVNGKAFALDKEHQSNIKKLVNKLNREGFRVIAVARKDTPKDKAVYGVEDEKDLLLIGFIGFLDPPKETATKAVSLLRSHGVEVKILTGDNEVVTKKICREVKLPVNGTLLGHQIEKMQQEHLEGIAEKTTIFAKLLPEHKERIIKALQKKGHTVGFLGDGINDTSALRASDVSISVDTAVDIAKESSSIILLEKSLLVLEDGIIEGRKVFGNITKYIRMAASSNFGNMLSVVGASIFLPFLPMLPLQVLVNNMLYDFSQIAIPTDNVDYEYMSKPRKWRIEGIKKYILCIGPISSIFDYTTYFMMIFIFNAWSNPALFQTGWFVESLLTQTLIIHVIRTNKIPFIQSKASTPLIITSLIIMSIGIWLPFSVFASHMGFVPLPSLYWPLLALTLLSYIVLTQVVKVWFVNKYAED